jgi:hypothetical protein
MTSQSQSHASEGQHHIADLLPAYLNYTLDATQRASVTLHLQDCDPCRAELANWQTIQDGVNFALSTVPMPSIDVLNQALSRIDAPARSVGPRLLASHLGKALRQLSPLHDHLLHLWLIFKRQIPLLHKSIWIGSALVILFGCVMALIALLTPDKHVSFAVSFLSLIMTVSSAVGVAFIYGAENDAGLEITLSTPTSIRIVMLFRLVLVVGFNLVLGTIASGCIAELHGGSLAQIMQLWFGPMLLLSSIALMFSLLLGSWFAVLVALVCESIQVLPLYIAQHLPALQLASPSSWQTTPTVLCLAVLFIVFAVLYAPRQPRLSN